MSDRSMVPVLGRQEREDAMTDSVEYAEAPIRYCVAHAGIVDTDAETCDFAYGDDGSEDFDCDLRRLFFVA